jgi:hypothetical protein
MASHRRHELPSPPLRSIRTLWLRWDYRPSNTVWPRCATTSANSEPKGSVEKLAKSRRYRLCSRGYSICLLFLKLFERIYSPLTAGLLPPYQSDSKLHPHKRTQLDRLYQKIV